MTIETPPGVTAMHRRGFLGKAAGLGALAALGAPNVARGQSVQPNVLMIVVDDLNDWISPLGGYPGVKTPNMARLAALGRVYQNGATNVPACSPSRTATLFGMHPTTTGTYTNNEEFQANNWLRNYRSLPWYFRNNGYATYGTGKVFHGHTVEDVAGTDPTAWDEYQFCTPGQDTCSARLDGDGNGPRVNGLTARLSKYAQLGGAGGFDFGPFYNLAEVPDVVRSTWMANSVLGANHDRPFFAACGINKPHLPFIVPRQFFDLYPGRDLVLPPGVVDAVHQTLSGNRDTRDLGPIGKRINQYRSDQLRLLQTGEWKVAVQAYLAAVSFADYCVGLLLNALLSGPNADNTIIVLWSDNGFQLGEKLAWRKFTLWERSLRVPMMLAGPQIQRGNSPMPASLIDLYPTLTHMCFNDIPNHLEGTTLRANLTRNVNSHRYSRSTWREPRTTPNNGPHFSVRTAEHRYIRYSTGEEELYDHRYDRYEVRNLLSASVPVTQGTLRVANRMRPLVPAAPYAPWRGTVLNAGD